MGVASCSLVALAVVLALVTRVQPGSDAEWLVDDALLAQVRASLPGCEAGQPCCALPRIPLDAGENVPPDAFHHGPLLLENATASWRAHGAVWGRPALMQAHGDVTVRAGIGAAIAKGGAESIPGSAGAAAPLDGTLELPFARLLERWRETDVAKALVLFQSDRSANRGGCTHLRCLLAPQASDTSEAAEFEVPVALRAMDSLVASVGPSKQGLPLHSHGAAWLALVRGWKLWFIFPPGEQSVPVGTSVEELLNQRRGAGNPHYCLQSPGEIVVLPHLWHHATFNIGDAVAVGGQVSGQTLTDLLACLEPLVRSGEVATYAEGFSRCER
eukprot:NODE_1109_length_1238_cov_309.480135.p1 GENE.NODE_1109_length_1238_cov_309.480135~~NODE_1109_length_1238_cov_309.480135.p1  ORF type:complete len:329 (-),score=16.83 NODE_1109_length_1238_cov_309.480135:234-1220(-)